MEEPSNYNRLKCSGTKYEAEEWAVQFTDSKGESQVPCCLLPAWLWA